MDARDDRGWTAMHFAAWNGNVSVVELLTDPTYITVQNGATIDDLYTLPLIDANCSLRSPVEAEDSLGFTPMHLAAWNGHLGVIQFLINKANLDAKSKDGQTPLHVAAQWGHLNVVKALAKQKANMFAKDHQNGLAIHYAARKGHQKLVEYFITENPQLLTEKGMASQTVLHEAATLGHLQLIRLLVQKYADLKSSLESNLLTMASDDGETALHAAVNHGHLAVVEYLVSQNIPIDAKDKDGQTANDLARELGNREIVEFLRKSSGLREESAALPSKVEEIKAAKEVAEIAQPGPIPALPTPGGHHLHVSVPRPKRRGYRAAVGRH